MLFKPKRIVKRLGIMWIRSRFIKQSCETCNKKYCDLPILIDSNTIARFRDTCLYWRHSIGTKFTVYTTLHVS